MLEVYGLQTIPELLLTLEGVRHLEVHFYATGIVSEGPWHM